MAKWQYTKGLHDLGNGCFAYLQPDGSWGWSNAGLIVDRDQTLLVDTLFDLKLTREMLDAMRAAVPAAKSIGRLVNTHANGDHTFGNQLVKDAAIIASRACAEEMKERPAEELAAMQRNWRQLGEAGDFLHEVMGSKFEWDDVTNTLPTACSTARLKLKVGDKEVALTRSAPRTRAATCWCTCPKDRTVFTGDILFVEGHPVLWAGPIENWVARLRPDPGLGRRDRRAGPRPDHRQEGRAATEATTWSTSRPRRAGATTPACRSSRRRTTSRSTLRELGRSPSASWSTSPRSTASSAQSRSSASWSCSARWGGFMPS